MIVVSHDRYFLDRTVDYLVSFDDGTVSNRYPAPFSTYQRLRREHTQTAEPKPSPVKITGVDEPAPKKERARKLTYAETRELAQIEPRIEALEARQAELQTAINGSGGDYRQMQEFAAELHAIETELETTMERWLELQEIAEESL
jgi:ATP-binding cassette subfamily F protein uup